MERGRTWAGRRIPRRVALLQQNLIVRRLDWNPSEMGAMEYLMWGRGSRRVTYDFSRSTSQETETGHSGRTGGFDGVASSPSSFLRLLNARGLSDGCQILGAGILLLNLSAAEGALGAIAAVLPVAVAVAGVCVIESPFAPAASSFVPKRR